MNTLSRRFFRLNLGRLPDFDANQIIEQGFVEFLVDDFSNGNFSDEELATVRKYFANRTTVRVPTCPMALNGCYGGFSISHKLNVNLYVRKYGFHPDNAEDNMESYYSIRYEYWRTDPILIEEILKIGLQASSGDCSDIYLQPVPVDFVENITIHEYDGLETAEYNCQRSIRSLINDDSISSSDLRQRLIELDFLSLAFVALRENAGNSRE